MAQNDFNINFGSNARAFANQLKRDLKPARDEIIGLQGLLDKLASDVEGKGRMLNALQDTLGKANGGGGGNSAFALEKIHGAAEDFSREMTQLKTELASVVASLAKASGQIGRISRGEGSHWDRTGGPKGTGGFVSAADVAAGKYPNAFRAGTLPFPPSLMRFIERAASQPGGLSAASPLAQPSSVRISDIGKVQLDTASVDRMVRAINEVRDEVRKLATTTLQTAPAAAHPGAAPAQAAPAATGGTAALNKVSKSQVTTPAEPAADDLETRRAKLEREVASMKVEAQSIKALIAQAGGIVDESIGGMMEKVSSTLESKTAELRALERETTGISKAEQSARNKAEFQRGPDLPEAEYDRRRLMRQRLDLALNPETFQSQIGRGKGKLSKNDLIDMAKQLTSLGFTTPSSKKLTTEQLGAGIVSGRQAMLEHFGADIPAELQTGRRIVADKVSDAVRQILHTVNITAAEAAEEEAAREALRLGQLSGQLPPNETLRATGVTGQGATSLAGQRLSGAIAVPPGMVKGGLFEKHDVYGVLEAIKLLQGRSLGRAAVLSQSHPEYDPFSVNLNREVTGSGEEARSARQAFRALRRGFNELDELGAEYDTYAKAVHQNRSFIERANARLEQGRPKETDAGKVEAAQRNIDRLVGLMSSQHFKGLQDLFEDPGYQAGRRGRETSQLMYQAQIEDRARRERETYVGDAAGYAIAGTRLAPGTKDTYIRAIPGLRYQGRGNKFGFTRDFEDAGHVPGELSAMNQAWWGMQAAQRRERGIRQEVAAGDRPEADLQKVQRRVEDKATRFLNQMEEIFGIAPRLEDLIGRTPLGRATGPVNPITGAGPLLTPHRLAQMGLGGLTGPSTELPADRYEWVRETNQRMERDRQQGTAERAGSLAVQAEASRKLPKLSPEAILAQREAAVATTTEKLAKAQAEETVAYARATELQEQLSESTARLTKAQREQYDAALAEAAAAERRVHQLSRQVIQRGNVAKGATPEESLFKMGTWQGHWDVNTGGGTTKPIGKYLGDQLAAAEREAAAAQERAAAIVKADKETIDAFTKQEALAAHLRAVVEGLDATLARQKAALNEAREELRGLSSKVPANVGSQEQRAAAKQTSEALRRMSAEMERAAKDQRRLTELRGQIKAGRTAGEDVGALVAEREAIKSAPGYMTKNELSALRKRYYAEMSATVAGGGGGEVPPGGRARTGGGGGGAGGWEGPVVAVLRDILTAVNGVHRTLQTGVRVTGGGGTARAARVDENGQPVETTTRTSTPRIYPGQVVAAQGRSGDEEQMALAAAAQQRVIERIRETDAMEKLHTKAIQDDASWERRRNEERRRGAAITAAEAHAELQLDQAMRLVDDATRVQLAELARLNREGADAVQIAEQQARAYVAMDAAMQRQGVSGTDRRYYAQALLSHANELPTGEKGPRVTRTQVDEVARSARGMTEYVSPVEKATNQMAGFIGQEGPFGRALQAMFGGHGFWARIMASTGTFIVRNFTAGFVFGITNALQEVVKQAILTESTFIRVSHALEATGKEVGSLRSDLQAVSTEYGTSLNDVYEVAAGLTGLFDNTKDLAAATKVVSQLEMISMGALNAKEAMGALASIQGAFADQLGTGVGGLEHVADVLTSVQNNVGTNVEVTAEAVGRMSGLAHQLGLSFEEVSVYGAQIAKLTNQTGGAAGEQFSRILGAMQTGRGRSAISQAFGTVDGRKTGIEGMLGARNYSGVLRTMQTEWGNLTKVQQQNVAVAVAGQRQAAAFAALMRNGSKTLAAITRAQYSYGDAQERTQHLMNTLNKQISKLHANFQNFANNLVRTGVLNFLGLVLKTTNALLGSLNHLLSRANDFADHNPLLKWAKDVGFGIMGMVLAIGLLQKSFRGLKASISGLPAVERFRQGASGATEEGTRPTVTQALRARAEAGVSSLGGVNRTPRADVGAPLSRMVGSGFERFLVRPMEFAGQQVTKFGSVLQVQAERAQANIGVARSDGATSMVSWERQKEIEATRAARLSRAGGIFSGIGQGIVGFAGGARDVLQGRGQQRFASLSEAAAGKAAQFRQTATEQYSQAAMARAMGDDQAARSARVLANSYTVVAAGADVSSRAAGRLSKSLGALARSGIGADAAMMAVTTAITAVITSSADNAEAAQRVDDVIKARWAKNKSGGVGQKPGEDYLGPAYQAYQEQTKDFTDKGSKFQAGMKYLGNAVADTTSGVLGTVTGGLFGNASAITRPWTGETARRLTGAGKGGKTYGLAEVQKMYDKATKDLQHQASIGASSEEMLKTQADFEKDLQKKALQIQGNSHISHQQQLAALAAIDQASTYMKQQSESAIAVSEGMKSAGLLEPDQIQRIGEAQDIYGKLQGQGPVLTDFQSGLTALSSQETGIDANNPEIQRAMDQLSSGTLGTAENAKAQATLIRERAKQAEVKYLAALQTGDPQEIDDKRSMFLQLMDQLATQTEAQIQAFVQTSTTLADKAAQVGDYTGSQEALQKGIADLETLKRGPKVSERGRLLPLSQADQEFNANIESQQRGLNQKAWEQAGQVANSTLQMQAAQGQGQVASARNNLRQQRNVLQVMQQAHDENAAIGPTAEQIHQQEVAVAQAKFQLGQQMAAKDVARMMLAAAGIWNEAQAAQASENVAAAQLQQAIQQYGRGSVEAMNARANLRNARKSAMQAEDSEAQAARDAAVAAIPQGNSVAIAHQQVANAYAALAAAKKYGTTSTQYQGALAQLYSAQQDAMHATQAVAQAQNQVAVALAEASGNTVRSAVLQLRGARLALAQALQNSGGAQSTEVLQAKAQVIQARAAARDARLQDELDTIDFNLQMGKITQSSAISALREILRTHNLTKQQRRQLLLQIKGMEKEISDSPWNFGDIKLPKPYLMKRYIEERRDANTKRLDAMVGNSLQASRSISSGAAATAQQLYNDNRNVEILINGGNLDQIRRVLREIVGTPTRTRTTAPRRGRR